jgi:alkyl hydroperoxide reductase subunit F
MSDVRVYSTKNCQYCRLLKAFLDRKKIKYENIDVGENIEAAKEMVELSGQYGVPVTVAEGKTIIGFDIPTLNEIFGIKREDDGTPDVIIIGGGPAGMTAAMYCSRKMLSTMIITENIGGQALESWSVENYMGFKLISGSDLMQKFEEQIRTQDMTIELDSVSSLKEDGNEYIIGTESGSEYRCRAVIITSGVSPKWLGLEKEERYIGRGISICSTCDGPLFRDKVVTVVGGGNYALTTAIEMSKIAKEVNLIVRSKIRADEIYLSQYRETENINTYTNYVVSELSGNDFLDSVTIEERETGEKKILETDGLFLAIGHQTNTAFLDGFVAKNDQGEIIIDINGNTDRKGVFSAGDVTSVKGKQIIIASGEGAKAALSAYEYLMSQR